MKPKRRFHIDFFVKIAMEEGIVNIHLVQPPTFRSNDDKKNTNNHHFGHKGKHLIVIYALNLSITKNHKTSFEALQLTISMIFDFIHPFAPQSMFLGRESSQNPSIISLQDRDLLLHGFTPPTSIMASLKLRGSCPVVTTTRRIWWRSENLSTNTKCVIG